MMPEDQCPWCLNHAWRCTCDDEDEETCSDCEQPFDDCECDE